MDGVTMQVEPQLLRKVAAMDYLAIRETKLDQLVRDGEIAVVRHGRFVRYRVDSLREWIERNTDGPAGALSA
jgi:excisionase family DNA binding protein